MYARDRPRRRLTGPGPLSVVLRGSHGRIRHGQTVVVRLGDGREVAGPVAKLEDGSIRVFLPEGAK